MEDELKIVTCEREVTIKAHSKVLDMLQLVGHQIDVCNNEVIVYFSECINGCKDLALGYLVDLVAKKEQVSNDYSVMIKTI